MILKRQEALQKLQDILLGSFDTIRILKSEYFIEIYYVDLIHRYLPRVPVANHVDILKTTEQYIDAIIGKRRTCVKSILEEFHYPKNITNTVNNECLIFLHEIREIYNAKEVVKSISNYNYWILAKSAWVGLHQYICSDNIIPSILSAVNSIRKEFENIGFKYVDTDDINYTPLPYYLYKR